MSNSIGRHGFPVPLGFKEDFENGATIKQMCEKYAVCDRVVIRWRKLSGCYVGKKIVRRVRWVVEKSGCWRCLSHKGEYPEGRENGKMYLVVKRLWEQKNGVKWPKGGVARHKCDNRWCVNPSHVIPGTQTENLKDAFVRRRNAYGNRHGNSKLLVEDVLWARRNKGIFSYSEMARKLGVAQSTLWIACNRGWKRAVEDAEMRGL